MEKRDWHIAVAATVGMAFWWPMLRNSIVGFLLAPDLVGEDWGRFALGVFLCLVVVFVAIGLGAGRHGSRLSSLVVFAPCLAASVSGLFLVSGLAEVRVAAMAVALTLACSYTVLPLAWAVLVIAQFGSFPKRMLLVLAASYAASFVVGYLSYAPEPWNFVRPVGAPLFSAAAWLYGCRAGGIALDRAMRGGAPQPSPSFSFWSGSSSLYLLVLVIFLASSVATGFINLGTASYVPSANTLVRDTLNVVVTLSIIAIIAASRQLERVKLTLMAVLIVLLFFGIFLATLFQQSWFTVGVGLVQTSKSCFSLLLFMLVVLEGAGCGSCVRPILLKFVLPTAASTCISYLVVPFAARELGVAYSDFWGILSLLLGFLLGMILFGFLFSIVVRYLPGMDRLEREKGRPESELMAAAMRQAYGLTEKESEVLALLLEGNTYKKIATLLFVSDSTVQSHAKNIYRKVDVHTKQQLVDRAVALREQLGL